MLRSRSFTLGFLVGLLLFAAANIYTSYPGYDSGSNNNGVAVTEEFDALKEFGWPFRLHRYGTIFHLDEILWEGLVADIAIAVCVSAGMYFFYSLGIEENQSNNR